MYVRKIGLMSLSVTLFMITMSGCIQARTINTAANTPQAVASCSVDPVTNEPTLYGLWVKEEDSNKGTQRELLTVTETSVYLVEFTGAKGNGALRETFYVVDSVDWVNSVVTMKMSWVRLNGKYGGFDYPLKFMKVYIDGETLYFSFGDEGQGIPAEAANGPWMKQ